MPELPEVESTARFLGQQISGCRVSSVEVRWNRSIASPSVARFRSKIIGSTFKEVTRRGKYIQMEMANPAVRGVSAGEQYYLFAHLRMSGSFDVVSKKAPRSKHDHVIISLNNGREIRFHDPRKFGKLYLVTSKEQVIGELGIEPFDPALTPEMMFELFQARRTRIKPLLLDQSVITGLGNIYVDETLWRAKVHPLRSANSISRSKCAEILSRIREVLSAAINSSGTDFGDGVVKYGNYAPAVYGRAGEPCLQCGSKIKRLVVGQRGTHICPRCQRS